MSQEDDDSIDDLPLPPLPPGLNFPPPPPPPGIDVPDIAPLPSPPPPPGIVVEDESIFSAAAELEDDSDDFQAAWERKKGENPTLSSDNRDRMYGHIDRIATGEVGTLLDRFSDRFGSELDREIIVLRKKQQQEMRDIKPTVELISAPEEDYEAEEDDEDGEFETESSVDEHDEDDQFPEFFNVVNDLLGGMPDDFVESFVASDDFALFQAVGSDPAGTAEDSRAEFFHMINKVLGDLPDDKINEFVQSAEFELFQAMGEIYGA